eukprot:4926654-Heterocapsa_arctica.AAC.1
MEPVASVKDGLLLTIPDDYLFLRPDQTYQKGNDMPTWWASTELGETADYDEDTLLHTARQIFLN